MPRTQEPPRAVMQPPWRSIAEELLKHKDPEQYRELKKARKLEDHLDDLALWAKKAYEANVRTRLESSPPTQEAWILQSAQELVTRDLLDPTT